MQSEIMRQYLIRLGYSIDTYSQSKFNRAISSSNSSITKFAANVGKSAVVGVSALAAVAVAAEKASRRFAYSMREMYFSSTLSGTSVKGLDKIAYAEKQVGIQAGALQGNLRTLQQNLRYSPGKKGLIESILGKPTDGMDTINVLEGVMKKLFEMPDFVGQQRAEQIFGMDKDTYTSYKLHQDELNKSLKEYDHLLGNLGPNYEESIELSKEYTKAMDQLGIKIDLVWDSIAVKLMPTFNSLTNSVADGVDNWKQYAGVLGEVGEALSVYTNLVGLSRIALGLTANPDKSASGKMKEANELLYGKDEGASETHKRHKARSGYRGGKDQGVLSGLSSERLLNSYTEYRGGVNSQDKKGVSANKDIAGYVKKFSEKFGVSESFINKIIDLESSGGKNAGTSEAGAQGVMQLMPPTARDMGVKNVFDTEENIMGGTKYLSQLLKKYGGNERLAGGAYNWGPGNMDAFIKTGKGSKGQPMPEETKDYMERIPTQGVKSSDKKLGMPKGLEADWDRKLGISVQDAKADFDKKLGISADAGVKADWDKKLGKSTAGLEADWDRKLGTENAGNTTISITANPVFNITGDDSRRTADMVVQKQTRVNGDIIRNMKGSIQ
ncbi:MAG: lytic transglycosylase domain-containing protein [Methylococcaceae bacterium]|jgi:hypothetical protein